MIFSPVKTFSKLIFNTFQSILTDASKTSNFTLEISTKILYVNQLDDATLVTFVHHLSKLTKQCSEKKKSIKVSLWSDWAENCPEKPSEDLFCWIMHILFGV